MSGVLVHEWLARTGGSENVMEVLGAMYPAAPIFCLWDDQPSRFGPGRVRQSWLARSSLRGKKVLSLPLMPMVWRRMPAVDADWVLCSSHLFAHHATFRGPAGVIPKYVYTHTPARYLWTPELDHRGRAIPVRAVAAALKPIDRRRAQEAESIAANSHFVKERIARTWERDSEVIHPPVDVAAFAVSRRDELSGEEWALLESLPSVYLLGASRFVPYKGLEQVLRMGVAAGLPVILAGAGPQEDELRVLATELGAAATFVIAPSRPLLRELFQRALVYVFPPVEDFGIMPVEAMATGTPVVANAIGGAAESVEHGKTGALLRSFDAAALRAALELAAASRPEDCVARAWEFDVGVFQRKIREWLPE